MKKKIMNRKGFTLVEVLIAIVFLGIGLLAVAGMQVMSIKGNSFSADMTRASMLARDRLEGLRALSFKDGDLYLGYHEVKHETFADSDPKGFFKMEYDVSEVTDSKGRARLIELRVMWHDKVDHRLTFSTIKSTDEVAPQ